MLGMSEITAMDKNVQGRTLENVQKEYATLFKEDGSTQSNEQKQKERKEKYSFIVDTYYNLVTSFYEYGWGTSFHFAPRFHGETFQASLVRHEHFLASKLGVSKGKKVLDMGCGVGGPMRTIARFTGANITGITINNYQVQRATQHNKNAGLDKQCNVVQGNFLKLPFEANTFDGAYAIEATCHAPKKEEAYGEAFRVLKPGAVYCIYEWCMTDKYDPDNAHHRLIKLKIEEGDGLPNLDGIPRVEEALKNVGFEILTIEDVALSTEVPWYSELDGSYSLTGFKRTRVGRVVTHSVVKSLEMVRLAPKGTSDVALLLNEAADALVEGGKLGIFTPMVFCQVRKPLNAK